MQVTLLSIINYFQSQNLLQIYKKICTEADHPVSNQELKIAFEFYNPSESNINYLISLINYQPLIYTCLDNHMLLIKEQRFMLLLLSNGLNINYSVKSVFFFII